MQRYDYFSYSPKLFAIIFSIFNCVPTHLYNFCERGVVLVLFLVFCLRKSVVCLELDERKVPPISSRLTAHVSLMLFSYLIAILTFVEFAHVRQLKQALLLSLNRNLIHTLLVASALEGCSKELVHNFACHVVVDETTGHD